MVLLWNPPVWWTLGGEKQFIDFLLYVCFLLTSSFLHKKWQWWEHLAIALSTMRKNRLVLLQGRHVFMNKCSDGGVQWVCPNLINSSALNIQPSLLLQECFHSQACVGVGLTGYSFVPPFSFSTPLGTNHLSLGLSCLNCVNPVSR